MEKFRLSLWNRMLWKRVFLTLCLMSIPVLLSYSQPPSGEDLLLNFDSGTSLPCPASDIFSSDRPDTAGTPTPVGIGMFFLQIFDIDDLEATFEADIFYLRYWKDPRLREPGRGKSYAICKGPLEGLWIPTLDIQNLRELAERGDSYAIIDAEGNVLLVERLDIILSNPMDLSDFPFDKQKLQVRVEPLWLSDKELSLYPLANYCRKAEGLDVNSWKIDEPVAKVSNEYAPFRGMHYFSMDISLQIQRETNFFLYKLIIPLVLIVLMSWSIFWVNPTVVAPQLGLGATSMLTIIAYQFALANMLPKISYQTRADGFILGSLGLVFLALAEAVTTAWLVHIEKNQIALKIDRVCRIGFPLAYAAVILTTLIL